MSPSWESFYVKSNNAFVINIQICNSIDDDVCVQNLKSLQMFHPIHLYFYCICVLNVLYLNLYLCCDDDDVCVYDLQMSHPIAMNLQLAIFRSDLRPPAGNRKLYLSIIFIFVNNCYQKKLVATKILYIKQRLPLRKTNPQTTPLIDTTSSTNAPKLDKFEQI